MSTSGHKKTSVGRLLRLTATPRFVLCGLALCNLLAVPARFGHLCFYNWEGDLWVAFLLLVAASALWLEQWWGHLAAAVLAGTRVYSFTYAACKVFDVIARRPGEAEEWGTREEWWGFMANHPEELFEVALAAAIFCGAVFYLIGPLRRRRWALP